jgi:hypothetical protein
MKKDKLQHGIYARTPKGFKENMKTMEDAGYSKKRAIGTAYGEAHMDMKHDCNMGYKKLQDVVKNL